MTARFQGIGTDGLFTLALSNIALVMTGGLSGLMSFARVWRVARHAPIHQTGMDAILVPGLRLEPGGLSADFAQRLDRARRLHRASAETPIVLLGGTTGGHPQSEARAAMSYLEGCGVPAQRCLLEEQSRNTLANLRAARELAHERGWGRVAIVSNRYHLARIGLLASGLGLDHGLCAAEEGASLRGRALLRLMGEAYYVHWYVVGRLWATLTRNRRSLERIS